MATKRGRPTDSVKSFMLRVRLDNETLEKLDACCEHLETTRSDVVREGISLLYDRTK